MSDKSSSSALLAFSTALCLARHLYRIMIPHSYQSIRLCKARRIAHVRRERLNDAKRRKADIADRALDVANGREAEIDRMSGSGRGAVGLEW